MGKTWKWRIKQTNPKEKWSNIKEARKGWSRGVAPPEKVEQHNVDDARKRVLALACVDHRNHVWGAATTEMRGSWIHNIEWLHGVSGLHVVAKIFFFHFFLFNFCSIFDVLYVVIMNEEVVLRRRWRWVKIFCVVYVV